MVSEINAPTSSPPSTTTASAITTTLAFSLPPPPLLLGLKLPKIFAFYYKENLALKMMSSERTRHPFTASQWQELEHQALIFKYMVSGMPIPPHLLYTLRRSLESPLPFGWSCFEKGFGRKIDTEPGRCRRTDGKKWRCSKEAYPDSKYCERHMHRGRNRSRKPVEAVTTTSSTNTSTAAAMSISSFPGNSSLSSPTNSPSSHHSLSGSHHPFLSLLPSRRSLGSDLSSQENTSTDFLLESYSHSGKGYSHGLGGKEEVNELQFFSETSGTMRSISGTSRHDSWQLTSPTMESPLSKNLKRRAYSETRGRSSLQLQRPDDNSRGQKPDYFAMDSEIKNGMDVQSKKVIHHFFDEWPPKDKDSCFDSEDDKLSRRLGASSKIQLSISMPSSSK